LPAVAVSLGPDPLTVGVTPVAHGAATAVPPAGALTLGFAVAAGLVGLAAGLVLDELGLELLQAAATSIRPATTPVTSTGCRRSLAWFGSILSTT
jgi:hypothetical protein